MRKGLLLLMITGTCLFSACESDSSESIAPGSPTMDSGGVNRGGSMARFSLAGDELYVLTPNKLTYFDISNPENISYTGSQSLEFGAETLFPYRGHLFIGTTTGMLIYDISDPKAPSFINRYEHVRSCDPVVVQDTIAYVTLRNGTACWGVNELHILNISDMQDIKQIGSYQMDNPHGLGVDGNQLFLCDGFSGMKVFDVADPYNIRQTHQYNLGHTYDVIPHRGLAIVVGNEHLTQYEYTPDGNIEELSSLPIFR
ncbi:LVIVD repeat-containing protein [Roseivirga sp. BDSF3-8]|uniref:LVIVD repeat-containing protein n=1 Tax=Roseivirga sp. BDSF3-8 TaxID=3241598 RepID=UPI0035322924